MQSWTEVESLKSTQLDKLVAEVKEIDTEIAGLEETKRNVRGLIRELIEPLKDSEGKPLPVDVGDQRVRWVPDGVTEKLSAPKLVAAGVTPEQIEAGTERGKRKGYVEIRTIKTGGSGAGVASQRDQSLIVARAAIDTRRRLVAD